MNTLIALALALVLSGCGGCKLHQPKPNSFMEGMSQQEILQTPQVSVFPHDDGLFVGYRFTTRDLTEQEDFTMLSMVIDHINSMNVDPEVDFSFDYTGKVIVFAYEGKNVDVTVTADYGTDEVELWTGFHNADWYIKKTYVGHPTDILPYLAKGVPGNPRVEEGKLSEEPKASYGPKSPCKGMPMFHLVLETL